MNKREELYAQALGLNYPFEGSSAAFLRAKIQRIIGVADQEIKQWKDAWINTSQYLERERNIWNADKAVLLEHIQRLEDIVT